VKPRTGTTSTFTSTSNREPRSGQYGVAIVNYRSATPTIALVRRLLADPHCGQVVIVNNDPSETTILAEWAKALPRVQVLHRPNVGYGSAMNLALRELTNVQRVALLNPDLHFHPELVLPTLLLAMDRTGAAVVGPRLTDSQGTVWRTAFEKNHSLTTIVLDFIVKAVGEDSLLGNSLRQLGGANRAYGPAGAVRALTGAFWVVDPIQLASVGGFDEDFFLYGEETDLCRRLNQQGHSIWFEPRVSATHLGGASSHGQSRRAQRVASAALQLRKAGNPLQARLLEITAQVVKLSSPRRQGLPSHGPPNA